MGYLIDAWLESGAPQLRIRDADTGVVRLRWDHASFLRTTDDNDDELAANRSLQCLFKDLILLACASKLSLAERIKSPAFNETCLSCDACVADSDGTRQGNVVYLSNLSPKRL